MNRETNVFIAPSADVLGDVTLMEGASVWYHATVRADKAPISIGRNSNIQDGCVVHVDAGYPVTIGNDVTVGHGAILHGCTIGDGALIGMGAILLNGCVIGKGCIVGAGALVTQGTVLPDGTIAMGSPAKVRRETTEEERSHNLLNAAMYAEEAAELIAAGESK